MDEDKIVSGKSRSYSEAISEKGVSGESGQNKKKKLHPLIFTREWVIQGIVSRNSNIMKQLNKRSIDNIDISAKLYHTENNWKW